MDCLLPSAVRIAACRWPSAVRMTARFSRSARISGKKGERIVYIRTLVSGGKGADAGRSIDTVGNTGQYL
jgi:hypothetical protein